MQKLFSAPAIHNTTRGTDIVDKGLGRTFKTFKERSRYLEANGYQDGHEKPPVQKRPELPKPTEAQTAELVQMAKQRFKEED
jgi:hypothetical protein